jgi:hypothetical protein
MTELFRCRVEQDLLEQAGKLSGELGTTTQEMVRLFLAECVRTQRVPLNLDPAGGLKLFLFLLSEPRWDDGIILIVASTEQQACELYKAKHKPRDDEAVAHQIDGVFASGAARELPLFSEEPAG